MNRLPLAKRAQLIHLLCEGMSLRGAGRVAGTAFNTVLKLQVEAGEAAEAFHDSQVRSIESTRVECDELWAFCHTKKDNLNGSAPAEYGDAYTWVAIDPATKLVISWWVGDRSAEDGTEFMRDLRERLSTPSPEIQTDALRSYAAAVERVFGSGVKHEISRSNSYVERNNLTIRMSNRWFARRTNAFSKKMENHSLSLALYFTFYNFCRPHSSLGALTTPAMAAGLAEFPMRLEELAGLSSK